MKNSICLPIHIPGFLNPTKSLGLVSIQERGKSLRSETLADQTTITSLSNSLVTEQPAARCFLSVPSSSNTALNKYSCSYDRNPSSLSTGGFHQHNLDVPFLTSLCSLPVTWTWQSCLEQVKYTVPLADGTKGLTRWSSCRHNCFYEVIQEGIMR